MKKIILEGKELSVKKENRILLQGGSFSVYQGELVAFCQTTQFQPFLPALLNTAQPEYEGELLFQGKPVNRKNPIDAVYVSGTNMLLESMSIVDNIFAVRKHKSMHFFYETRKAEEKLNAFLEDLGIYLDLNTPVVQLTASQQYILLLAKAILLDAPLIVLDNFSQHCSRDSYDRIRDIIFRYCKKGKTFILLSSDNHFLLEKCDRIYFCRGRRVVDLVFRDEYSGSMFQKILFGYPVQDFRKKETAADYTQKVFEMEFPGCWCKEGRLEIYAGEVFGILDLYGTLTPRIFRLFLEGFPYRLNGKVCRKFREAIREGLAIVSLHQGNMIFGSLTLSENLMLMKLKELSRGFVRNKRLEDYFVGPYLSRLSASYTYSEWDWEQLKLLIYRWLLLKPRVMVIDNPPFDLEEGKRTVFVELLQEVTAAGCAVILLSSSQNDMRSLCDRVLAIQGEGKNELINLCERW